MQLRLHYKKESFLYVYKVITVLLVALLVLTFLPAKSEAVTVAPATLTVLPDPVTETDIVGGTLPTITLTLTDPLGPIWNLINLDGSLSAAKCNSLFNSMSAGSETYEWSKVVNQLIKDNEATPGTGIVATDNYTLVITLPAVANYNIKANQTITVIPPSTLLSRNIQISPLTPFTIQADPAAIISGTITNATTAADIVNGGKSIVITLNGVTWNPDVVDDTLIREELIDAFLPIDPNWDKVKDAIKSATNISSVMTVNNSALTITLPPVSSFRLSNSISIDLLVPGNALSDNTVIIPNVVAGFTISPVTTVADLTGTMMSSVTEGDIESGGKTIIITLINDSWAPDVAFDQSKRELLLDGFTANSDISQWIGDPLVPIVGVIPTLKSLSLYDPKVVVRTSSKVITITLPAVINYNITANQTINLTIPNSVLSTTGIDLQVFNEITILPMTAAISGTFVSSPPTNSDMVAGGKTIIVTLSNSTWAADVSSNTLQRNLLIDGFTGTDPVQWNNVNIALKAKGGSVVRTSNNVVTITLPPVPSYDLLASGQDINLSIVPNLITKATTSVAGGQSLTIIAPTTPATSGQSITAALGADPTLALYLSNINKVTVSVPKKYINTITINPTPLANITTFDVLTDNMVDTTTVSVEGKGQTISTFTTMSDGKHKFTFAFGGLNTSVNSDITFSVLSSGSKLQNDVTEKLTKTKKDYTLQPTKELSGTYSLYQLINDTQLLKGVLDAYSLSDLIIR